MTVFYEFPASNYLLMTLRLKLNNITKPHVESGALFRTCKQRILHIIGIVTTLGIATM